mgnify:CR=1 FL=1
MGVSWFSCDNCGETVNDCMNNTRCVSCGGMICETCTENDRCHLVRVATGDAGNDYACKACFDDTVTSQQQRIMLNYLLEASEHKTQKDLREHLRKLGKIKPAPTFELEVEAEEESSDTCMGTKVEPEVTEPATKRQKTE